MDRNVPGPVAATRPAGPSGRSPPDPASAGQCRSAVATPPARGASPSFSTCRQTVASASRNWSASRGGLLPIDMGGHLRRAHRTSRVFGPSVSRTTTGSKVILIFHCLWWFTRASSGRGVNGRGRRGVTHTEFQLIKEAITMSRWNYLARWLQVRGSGRGPSATTPARPLLQAAPGVVGGSHCSVPTRARPDQLACNRRPTL